MTKIALLLIALAGVAIVASQAAVPKTSPERKARMAAMEKRDKKLDRAYEIRPRRRDSPLRYENITDDEVREIQLAASAVVPRALVNISGVTTGCPCEDGPGCSDQVWILASRPNRTVGLLLSKVDGRWVIGPVQRWWLQYDDLQSRMWSNRSYSDYGEEEDRLIDVFPVCAAQPAIPADVPATRVRP